MKVAIYARVSTANNGQDPTMQTRELREYAERRGWTVTGEYVDIGISGTKEKRPELTKTELVTAEAEWVTGEYRKVWVRSYNSGAMSSGVRKLPPTTAWAIPKPNLDTGSGLSQRRPSTVQRVANMGARIRMKPALKDWVWAASKPMSIHHVPGGIRAGQFARCLRHLLTPRRFVLQRQEVRL